MTQDIFASGSSAIDERSERAQRAVRAFRAMQPGLSGYARAITGRRDVQVELAQGIPRTDGKKIFFKPPIALGDLTPHDRSKCERRDRKTKLMLCDACRTREEVLISIYHEIAHIVFGTFEEPTSKAKFDAVERAVAEVPGKFADKVRETFKSVPDYKKKDYLNLSSLISPYLPILVNALEDARVDDGMFKARKGTKVMFDAYVQSVFANGVEEDNGTRSSWADKPLNSQALIGVFVLACQYKYEGWFHPTVEAALGDARLRELAGRVDTLRSAEGSYNLAFPILARLRELGFCKLPEEEPEPEQEPEESPQDEEQQGEDDEAEDSADEAEDESGDDSQGDPTKGDGESDAGDGEDSEGADGDPQSDGGGDSEDDGDNSDEDSADSNSDAGDDASSRADAGDDGAGESESEHDGDAGTPSEEEDSGSRSDGDSDDSGQDNGDGTEGPEAGSDSEGSGDGSVDGADGADSSSRDDSSDPDGERDLQSLPSAGGESDGPLPDLPEEGELTDEDSSAGGEDREEDRSGDTGDSSASPEEGSPEASDDVEVIDSGADEGEGGTEADAPEYGTPEQSLNDVQVFSKHEAQLDGKTPAEVEDDKALDVAIIQGQYFEKPSANVNGVREHKYGQPLYEAGRNISVAWTDQYGDSAYYRRQLQRLGIDADTDVPETILGPALNEMRRTFSDNARGTHERHLKSGKINAKVLGKRAPFGDQRLFQKKRLPGKRSYAVILGIDISGSTVGVNIALAKRAAMAQAELLNRMGIDFAIYAHTANGSWTSYTYNELWLDVYEIKPFSAPWNDTAKEALSKISSDSENLDGHTIEFYRKTIERHPATDKIILYYSDGKMPAANHDEELEILQREIAYCKAHQITLLGVGIRTDSPRRHGLDTVQVDDDSDTSKVVRHLQSALLHCR